jgi:hypothetical protein
MQKVLGDCCGLPEIGRTMKPPKTIIFAGNLCGGQHKSTSIATLGDCLQTLGHTVKYIALDIMGIPMLKRLHPPTTQYDPRWTEAMDLAMRDAVQSPEEIVLIDCPGGGWGEKLPDLASLAQQELGARVIIAPIIDAQSENSIEGAAAFIEMFSNTANEYAIIANNWPENPESHNVLLESEGGKLFCQLARDRVIQFPPFSQRMRRDFHDKPAVPSAYMTNSNPFEAAPWKSYHKQCLESVAKYAEWLAGKPTPTAASR